MSRGADAADPRKEGGMGAGPWLRLTRGVLCGLLAPLCFAASGLAAAATITAVDQGNGGVLVTATGTFATCTYCDANGKNCFSTNNGSIAAYRDGGFICSKGGSGSATCTATLDRGSLHGSHNYTATASDCKGSSSAGTSTDFDNTPSITVTGPSGTVSEPFDITGTATFKPTLSATKGSINVYINGGWVTSKSCTTEACSFSYKEITGNLYDMNHGGPYTITMTAYGGGAQATANGSFSVNKTPTVNVTGPSGTVSGPFDITGTATFKPTLSATKGSIHVLINGGWVTSKSCTTENCSFSYKEITGNLYDMNHGGPYTITMTAYGGGASATDTGSFSVNKTPTVSVTGPSGTVTGPFDITGTATFKPTLSATKGSINVYINGGWVTSKSCATENCSFSYKEITGNLYTLSPGQSYTVKLTASGGGASASDEKSFFVEDLIPDQGCPEPAPDVSSCCNK